MTQVTIGAGELLGLAGTTVCWLGGLALVAGLDAHARRVPNMLARRWCGWYYDNFVRGGSHTETWLRALAAPSLPRPIDVSDLRGGELAGT